MARLGTAPIVPGGGGYSQTAAVVAAAGGGAAVVDSRPELRRRITTLMLFRLVLITVVLGITVALNVQSPDQLAAPAQVFLFGIIGVTYALTLLYAYFLPRVAKPIRFADAQVAGDLLITTILVYATGGSGSGYTFFYPLSIIGAATVRHRRGAVMTMAASVLLLVLVALVEEPAGGITALRQLTLNIGACLGIGVLSAFLGEQLAQSSERLALQRVRAADLAVLKEYIIRSLSSGLLTVDRAGMVMTVNQAASEILHLDGEAVIGRPVTELLPSLEPVLAELGDRQTLRRGEIRATSGGRELALGVSVTPLTDHRGEAIGRILNFQDLTELRRMEVQVKRAERLAVIGGVAAAVAHEIRNPLASISGSIELLRSAPQVGDENRQLMDIVVREVDRLNGLLGDLLDYARPRERVAMRIELGGVIEETVRVFAQDRSFAEVKVRAVIDPEAAARPVQADPAQLRQVVWNLLRNAAEAMPKGGEVRIELADVDGWAELRVVDEGVGISPEDQEHIFEPFYSTKSRGSGLGLATVHRIVTEHGGTIAVASTVGKGTTVTVRLPRAG